MSSKLTGEFLRMYVPVSGRPRSPFTRQRKAANRGEGRSALQRARQLEEEDRKKEQRLKNLLNFMKKRREEKTYTRGGGSKRSRSARSGTGRMTRRRTLSQRMPQPVANKYANIF
jgi:hypothetical protein